MFSTENGVKNVKNLIFNVPRATLPEKCGNVPRATSIQFIPMFHEQHYYKLAFYFNLLYIKYAQHLYWNQVRIGR